ncbi:hypothetical protein PHYBOEH_009844 [Phytophthora boehmeriae]|uniref:Uncharacterized protein n=1 Tax=Phytophthora boehmeriae TaxID=109152 RepID=A0A8T1X043_9STRA|nr:hypothetical protein PHYBOEH_009844 [Phytophthora boehmeriae]
MDERDVMVSWLEQGDNFSRAMHLPASSDTTQVKQANERVWIELEMAVNAAIPSARWTPEIAFQSVGECVMQYLKAANEAKRPDFKVSGADKRRGIHSIQEKLEDKCRHFARLAKLHAPKNAGNIFQKSSKNSQTSGEKDQQMAKEKKQEQPPKADSIVPESDESKENESVEMKLTRQGDKKIVKSAEKFALVTADDDEEEDEAFPVRPPVKRPMKAMRKSPKSDEDDGAPWLRRKLRRVTRYVESEKESGEEVSLSASTTRSVPSETSRRRFRIDSLGILKKMEQSSDSDEPLARTRSRHKSQSQHGTPRANASRRVTRSSDGEEKSNDVDAKPMRTTRSSTSAEFRSRVGTDQQDTLKQVERSPSSTEKTSSIEKATRPDVSVAQPVQVVNSTNNGHQATVDAKDVLNGNVSRAEVSAHLPTQTTASSTAFDESNQDITGKQHASRPVDRRLENGRPSATESTRVGTRSARAEEQQGHLGSDALRSAIAQVVSQRQQLMNSRTTLASNVRIRPSGLPSESEEVYEDESLAVRLTPAEHHSDTERKGRLDSLARGFRPPLLNSNAMDGKQDLQRKRAYLRAKQLAFEQVKWHSENELQNREVSLLRREMEAREMLAHKELKLKQLRIRAEIMQPMILAGASVVEIAEQLKLL